MRCFECNSPDHPISSCPRKQLYEEEHGSATPVKNVLVGGMRKRFFDMGVFHTQTAGSIAAKHFILDAGASRSMASQKRFRNHGKWIKSHGRNPRALERGGAMFKFGNGNVTKSLGLSRTEICIRGHWAPREISIFAAIVPNLPSCWGRERYLL